MLRVLVVDDDRNTTATMRLLLRAWGHAVATVTDGAAAVGAADAYRPDVVLLDLALGGPMDGLAVARLIRRQGGARPVLVCVSGYGGEEDRRRSRAAGCDHHLLKPADPDELRHLLQAVPGGFPPGA
jgi:two-component system CheB/CheR fusion protein